VNLYGNITDNQPEIVCGDGEDSEWESDVDVEEENYLWEMAEMMDLAENPVDNDFDSGYDLPSPESPRKRSHELT